MIKEQRTKIVKYLEQTLRKMRGLFSNTYIQSIAEMKDAIEAGADFKWEDFKAQSLKIDKMIESLLDKSGLLIHNAVQNTYQIGVENAVLDIREKYENLKKKYTRKKDFRELDTDATSIIRSGAQDKQRKGEQLDNLSDRVWNLQDQVKDNITIIIKNAIAQGDSPKQAQSSVVKYLQNPKLITMHVYDKDGNLTLSEEAKNLHPGRGVYRDPLKNAERLLRTEIMAAYRQAEIEQYQKTDLVIGYEIKLSGNHTTTDGKGGIKKLKDICDKLQGRYPKTFMWHGWHPNCRCVLLPLYVSDDKMESYFDAKHNGTLDEWNKKNQISDLPNNFNQWVEDNSQRLNLAQNAKKTALPQWVEGNINLPQFKELASKSRVETTRFTKQESADKPNKALKKRYKTINDIKETLANIDKQLKGENKLFKNGIQSLGTKVESDESGNTDGYGKINIAPDRMRNIKSALSKIANYNSKGITYEEADSLATLWHEITHNKNKAGLDILTDRQKYMVEVVNEFVARKTLPDFYKILGVNDMPYIDMINSRESVRYNNSVVGFDFIVKALSLDYSKVLQSVIDGHKNTNLSEHILVLKNALINGGLLERIKVDNNKISEDDLRMLINLVSNKKSIPEISQFLIKGGFIH